jgi:arginine/lysine/ornithine decarboxylase
LVVSPTYFGVRSEIEELHRICKYYNSVLIVDEAHGAHLRFLPEGNGKDALQSGAELVVQSTHKQLGSLTQSSMLHAQHININIRFRVERMLSILQSSSPSYLLMGSLDAARAQMEDPKAIQEPHLAAMYLHDYFKTLQNKRKGPCLSLLDMTTDSNPCTMDPWRFTVMLHDSMIPMTGWSMSNLLEQEKGIVAEMATRNSVVFACGIGTTMKHAYALTEALDWFMETHCGSNHRISTADVINHRSSSNSLGSMMSASIPEMIPSSVLFGNNGVCMVPFETSQGQIAAELVCPYPPGIPIILPGDCISRDQIGYIRYVIGAGGYVTGSTDASMQRIAIVQQTN